MLDTIIIFGTISGLIYALIALGFTLVYGISGMVNLTHGAFFIIGAYIYGILMNYLPGFIPLEFSYLTPLLALVLSFLCTGLIGSIFYRLALHQLLGDEVGILVVSVCGCLIFQQLIYIVMGTASAFQFSIKTLLSGVLTIGTTKVLSGRALAAIVSFLAFVTLSIVIAKTKTGKAMKALSQDLEASMLMGISTEKLYVLTTAISAGLASLAGVLYLSTTTQNVSAYMWLNGLAISFTIVILGGLGSIKGTLIGGLIFGYSEAAVIAIIPYAGLLLQSFPFIVMVIVLIIRPKGLFGKRIEME